MSRKPVDPNIAQIVLALPNAEATARAGALLAPLMRPTDVLALWGDLGAGKTSLARALIQTCLAKTGQVEDVPSPTFTLVQTYETADLPIWHADLYRLKDPDELIELGLDEALETGFLVLEWPDRMGADLPVARLDIELTEQGEGRVAKLTGPARLWEERLGCVLRQWTVSQV